MTLTHKTRTAPDWPGTDTALAPLRAALLAHARSDAAAVLADADTDVAVVLADAEQEAAGISASAAAEAAADAASVLAAQRARTRRQARAIELQARRAAYDELRSAVHRAVPALVDNPLRDRLAAAARAEWGPEATIAPEPDGIVAESGGRRISYRLTALADRALAEFLADT